MDKKLKIESINIKKDIKIDDLFYEFSKPVHTKDEINFKKYSIMALINESVDSSINDIVTKIINSKSILTSSENVSDIAKICEKFFQDTNFGTFEYVHKTGRGNFRISHSSGNNGGIFLTKFFENIFNICLKKYTFHIISDENSFCVTFR